MKTMQVENNQQGYARRWVALAALSFSILVISLDLTVLNVALPTLVRALSATTSQLQWMVDAYTLLYAGLLLTTGSLGDRYGRKRALIVGMVVFGAGSVWSAYSGSANMLIMARGLMGMGGALIMPSTLSITANIFAEKQRASAIGVLTGVGGLGIVIGPLLGGWLLEHFTWGTIFLINVPIIALALLVSLWLVPESKDEQASRLDPVGALLSIADLMALLYGIIEVPTYGMGDPRIITAFSAAPLLLLVFVVWELRARSPMLDVKVFADARFTAASMALTLTSFALAGTMFFLTQYLQLVLGYTPLQAGICFIPLVLGLLLMAALSPVVARRTGVRATITGGLGIVAVSIALFSILNASSSYVSVAIILALLGAGLGLTMVTATNTIMGTLPLGKAGVGSAVNDTAQEVGGALGVAILGSVLAASYHAAINAAPAIQALPMAVKAAARDSIGGASVIASHLGGSIGHVIALAANNAFTDSMSHTALVAAGVSLCGLLVALFFLPSRARDLTEPHSLTTMERQKEESAI